MWALLVFARVVEEQACCGRVCLWVAGVRVYARGVFVWVFALLGVGALVWWWGSVAASAFVPACLFACSRPGVGLLACARLLRARWVEGGLAGAGQRCPAPLRVLVALPG